MSKQRPVPLSNLTGQKLCTAPPYPANTSSQAKTPTTKSALCTSTMIIKDIRPTRSLTDEGAGAPTGAEHAESRPSAAGNGDQNSSPPADGQTPSPIFSPVEPTSTTSSTASSTQRTAASSFSTQRIAASSSSLTPSPSPLPVAPPLPPPPPPPPPPQEDSSQSTQAIVSSPLSKPNETPKPKQPAPIPSTSSSRASSDNRFQAFAIGEDKTDSSSTQTQAAAINEQPTTSASNAPVDAVAPSSSSTSSQVTEILDPANTATDMANPTTLVIAGGSTPVPTASSSLGFIVPPTVPSGSGSQTILNVPSGTEASTGGGGEETGNADLKLQPAQKSSSSSTGIIIGSTFGAAAVVALIAIFIWLWRRRARRRQLGQQPLTPLTPGAGESLSQTPNVGSSGGSGSSKLGGGFSLGGWTRSSLPRGRASPAMRQIQPSAGERGMMPGPAPGSSSGNNPFSDANAIDKQPLRGILKPSNFMFPVKSQAVGVAATSDVAVPPVPPRSRARTGGAHRASQSLNMPPSRPQSSRRASSMSLSQFGERRDKFRSDPFDLELDTNFIPDNTLATTTHSSQNVRASSIYSSHTTAPSIGYTSGLTGLTVSTLSDVGDSPINPSRTWDSPTLGKEDLKQPGKKWPDSAFGVGQAL